MINVMLPDSKQLYAALLAVSREAFIARDSLFLPWGERLITDCTPMPVASLHFDICPIRQKINRIDLEGYLTFKAETMLVKKVSNSIFEGAGSPETVTEPTREFRYHFGRRFIDSIPSMEACRPAESMIVVIYP